MPLSRSIVRAAGDPLVGTSPTDTRLALAAFVARAASAAWGARPGVLWGGAVSGTSSWTYNVAAAALITTRGALEGVYPAANTGVTSVGTDPAPGSGSRIDVIYARQQDTDVGDTGNASAIAVAIGAASATPVAPSIPAGALELARATVASGAANTLAATITQTARITALAGGAYEVPNVAALSRVTAPLPMELARVGTDRLYVYQGGDWRLAWTPPIDWTASGVSSPSGVSTTNVQYMVDSLGEVSWQGELSGASTPAENALLLTFPATIAPPYRRAFDIGGLGGSALVFVGVYGSAGSLNTLCFRRMTSGGWGSSGVLGPSLAGMSWQRA